LLKEGGGIAELNPDQPRLGKPVYMFLLNDTLVIAYRKKRAYGKQKLFADKIWPLNDVAVNDRSDMGTFTLAYRRDEVVYRADSDQLKQEWIVALRKAIQELNQSQRRHDFFASTSASSHIRRLLTLAESTPTGPTPNQRGVEVANDAVMSLFKDVASQRSSSPTKDRSAGKDDSFTSPDLAWIKDMPDELDVFIAHRDFDKAVQCVERGKISSCECCDCSAHDFNDV
jgi:hypothetical protein